MGDLDIAEVTGSSNRILWLSLRRRQMHFGIDRIEYLHFGFDKVSDRGLTQHSKADLDKLCHGI